MRVEIDGIQHDVLADRALFRSDASTVIVADLHLGKPATFRADGVPVPEGVTASDLDRLSCLIDTTRARRLVVLGDFLHASRGRTAATMDAASGWRRVRAGLEMILVRGNHDRSAGDPPRDWDIACIDGPAEVDGMMLAHEPSHVAGRTVLCGHLHPAIRLAAGWKTPGGSARTPCLWLTRDWAVMPAFGGFTGARTIRAEPGDRVLAFGDDGVVEVPARILA